MARRIVRPAALWITWWLSPWGVSATMATSLAWAVSMMAGWAFGWGNAWGWTLGAIGLQLWYLLDHVDGQLARLHGTSSLEGVQLDYLMHHSVNLIIPFGVGWGMFRQAGAGEWILAGFVWGWGMLLIGLLNDTRYKAFFHRLWSLRNQGRMPAFRALGTESPHPHASVPWKDTQASGNTLSRHLNRSESLPPGQNQIHREMPLSYGSTEKGGFGNWLAGMRWVGRKACEIHVVMNFLTCLAVIVWLAEVWPSMGWIPKYYVGGMSILAPMVGMGSLWRSQARFQSENEFALWFSLPMEEAPSGYPENREIR